jgi:hypothetical protein
MNTTTTKIAGEAMTDAEIREIAARIYGTEATEQEIRFAAALLASKSVHLSKDEAATWVEQLKALYETDCGFDTGWRMACERVITYLNDASAVLASGASLPEGWKLVPVELTEHMLDEADFAMQNHVGDPYTDADGFDGWYQPVWKAILAASPTAPAQSCGDAEQADAPMAETVAAKCDGGTCGLGGYCGECLRDAEADEAVTELQNIVNAKRFDHETFADDTEFADWVQSRARHTLARAKDSK